ncbi:MAG: hypothetical protein ACLUNO_13925 [Oscillospiraceae bacterium]
MPARSASIVLLACGLVGWGHCGAGGGRAAARAAIRAARAHGCGKRGGSWSWCSRSPSRRGGQASPPSARRVRRRQAVVITTERDARLETTPVPETATPEPTAAPEPTSAPDTAEAACVASRNAKKYHRAGCQIRRARSRTENLVGL